MFFQFGYSFSERAEWMVRRLEIPGFSDENDISEPESVTADAIFFLI